MREEGARLRCSCAKSLSLLCEGHSRTHARVARSRSFSSLSTSPPRPSLSLPTATDSWSRRPLVRKKRKFCLSAFSFLARSFFFGENAYPPHFCLVLSIHIKVCSLCPLRYAALCCWCMRP